MYALTVQEEHRLHFHFDRCRTPGCRSLLKFYYRLMGAKFGRDVTISSLTNIKEFDLVSIGDGCILDACTISPFALHAGAFELQPTAVGKRVIIGPKCIVAPGASVPDDAYIGHGQSSHEVDFRYGR